MPKKLPTACALVLLLAAWAPFSVMAAQPKNDPARTETAARSDGSRIDPAVDGRAG